MPQPHITDETYKGLTPDEQAKYDLAAIKGPELIFIPDDLQEAFLCAGYTVSYYLKPVEAQHSEGVDSPIAAAFKEYKNLIERHNKDLPSWDKKLMDWQTFYEGWQEITALQQDVERLKDEQATLRDTLFQTLRESTVYSYTYCQLIVDKVLPPTK